MRVSLRLAGSKADHLAQHIGILLKPPVPGRPPDFLSTPDGNRSANVQPSFKSNGGNWLGHAWGFVSNKSQRLFHVAFDHFK